jgi:hypothetical protein
MENVNLSHLNQGAVAAQSTKSYYYYGGRCTRPEDIAYGLTSVCEVSMPVLYGEGKSFAIRRLQEAVDLKSEPKKDIEEERVSPLQFAFEPLITVCFLIGFL